MKTQRCDHCRCQYEPKRHIRNQRYCSKQDCQRARRRNWKRQRYRTDQDYRDNQAVAQRKWMETHPDYWRRYRATHPNYVEKNRKCQRARDIRHKSIQPDPESTLAKGNAYTSITPFKPGTYQLTPCTATNLANGNASLVEISLISCG